MSYKPNKEIYKEFGQVNCPCCDGTGFTPIPMHLDNVYGAILELKEDGVTADQIKDYIWKHLDEKPTHVAINARLTKLYHMGIVKKSRVSKHYIWAVS